MRSTFPDGKVSGKPESRIPGYVPGALKRPKTTESVKSVTFLSLLVSESAPDFTFGFSGS